MIGCRPLTNQNPARGNEWANVITTDLWAIKCQNVQRYNTTVLAIVMLRKICRKFMGSLKFPIKDPVTWPCKVRGLMKWGVFQQATPVSPGPHEALWQYLSIPLWPWVTSYSTVYCIYPIGPTSPHVALYAPLTLYMSYAWTSLHSLQIHIHPCTPYTALYTLACPYILYSPTCPMCPCIFLWPCMVLYTHKCSFGHVCSNSHWLVLPTKANQRAR